LGQAELARRLGTAQPAISRIERDAVSPSVTMLNRIFEAMGETIVVRPVPVAASPPGGGNQSIAELRADYRDLSAEARLSQAARLSKVASELAAQAEG
jgi:transcriptional regulator with XRE-family HTH domain